MTAEEKEQFCFQMILHAGNSRSLSMEAAEKGRNRDYESCDSLIQEARKELQQAHQYQSELIQKFASGEEVASNVLISHAQDHLIMATLSLDFVQEIIALRKELNSSK